MALCRLHGCGQSLSRSKSWAQSTADKRPLPSGGTFSCSIGAIGCRPWVVYTGRQRIQGALLSPGPVLQAKICAQDLSGYDFALALPVTCPVWDLG